MQIGEARYRLKLFPRMLVEIGVRIDLITVGSIIKICKIFMRRSLRGLIIGGSFKDNKSRANLCLSFRFEFREEVNSDPNIILKILQFFNGTRNNENPF